MFGDIIGRLRTVLEADTTRFKSGMEDSRRQLREFKAATRDLNKGELPLLFGGGALSKVALFTTAATAAAATATVAFSKGREIRDQWITYFEDGAVKADKLTEALKKQLGIQATIRKNAPTGEDIEKQTRLVAGLKERLDQDVIVARLVNDRKMLMSAEKVQQLQEEGDRLEKLVSQEQARLAAMQADLRRFREQEAEDRRASLFGETTSAKLDSLRRQAALSPDAARQARAQRDAILLEEFKAKMALNERLRKETDPQAKASIESLIRFEEEKRRDLLQALENELQGREDQLRSGLLRSRPGLRAVEAGSFEAQTFAYDLLHPPADPVEEKQLQELKQTRDAIEEIRDAILSGESLSPIVF